MRLVRIIPILAILLLAACSKSGSSTPKTIEALSTKAGCSSFTKDTGQLELYVQESGNCVVDGKDVQLYLFESDEKRDSWLNFGKGTALDVSTGIKEHGTRWVANGDDRASVEKVAAALK